MTPGQLEDTVFESNLPTEAKIGLLQALKERRDVDEAREKATHLNRILACVLHGMHLDHGDGVVLPITPDAARAMTEMLLTQRPVIQLNSLADGGAEVSLTWEPR